MKFIKKPAEVNAMQWDGTEQRRVEIEAGLQIYGMGANFQTADPCLWIPVPSGRACAHIGEWVLKTETGQILTLSDALFRQMYAPAVIPAAKEQTAALGKKPKSKKNRPQETVMVGDAPDDLEDESDVLEDREEDF